MLEINMEFRKGILFVRLKGKLNNDTTPILDKEVTRILKEYKISNVVFNVLELTQINQSGISILIKNYEVTSNYSGKAMLCGIKNNNIRDIMKKGQLFKYLYEVSDELTAIDMVNM